ncbi:hypothetical protein FisN_19Lh193 [Fistulifera solaris]|uniref:Uncharacterized protein n=1 Tax=Fistulifera solaris TaxID=1519565 RepID=A0A1Z5J6V2_FISSO|nr:hypothetical protein FisN_19Lh193 [Fistulifera solaris]|eukprot:GAX09723.1 hypothetical protein FisN_19Lh193 [Fistulifera solaris]
MLFTILLSGLLFFETIHGARFEVNSAVTVTVKDPSHEGVLSAHSLYHDGHSRSWFDISSLQPNAFFNIRSKVAPIPVLMPSLKSIDAGIGYNYNDLKRLPSLVDVKGKFSLGPINQLEIQPVFDLRSGQKDILLQFTRGPSYIFSKLSNQRRRLVESINASALFYLPFASLSTLRLSPSVDFRQTLLTDKVTCTIEAVTGGAGRTKTILNLRAKDPTLSMVYALSDSNVIAPEIHLKDARVLYQWSVKWNNGAMLHTKVDPSHSIDINWTDQSTGGGKWITDIRLPLEGTSIRGLAAEVKVRRQFIF